MAFWEKSNLEQFRIITPQKEYTSNEINEVINNYREYLVSEQKELVLLKCNNTIDAIAIYIAALNEGHAIMLISEDTNLELLESIVTSYKPKWLFGEVLFDGYERQTLGSVRKELLKLQIHPNLAVLLSTSGTTGSQKFVRLSYENIQSNAESIVSYLQITTEERAVMNLPFSYSYGMSIVNSHLEAGASILLTEESVMSKTFWSFMEEKKATSFAGVPFTYQMLQRIGFLKMDLPHLKTLTQAGGSLNEKIVEKFGEYAKVHDSRFYVMYGQTEASPRISYIPPERLLEKPWSIGIAVPGGELSICQETSELIYKGPNVMLGYAKSSKDLTKGDELKGILYTGDIATVDEEGYFTITGRLRRFIKLFGLRISLDEVERKLESELQLPIACVGADDRLTVVLEEEAMEEVVRDCLRHFYKLNKSSFRIVQINVIPRLPNGKTDYRTLKDDLL